MEGGAARKAAREEAAHEAEDDVDGVPELIIARQVPVAHRLLRVHVGECKSSLFLLGN